MKHSDARIFPVFFRITGNSSQSKVRARLPPPPELDNILFVLDHAHDLYDYQRAGCRADQHLMHSKHVGAKNPEEQDVGWVLEKLIIVGDRISSSDEKP